MKTRFVNDGMDAAAELVPQFKQDAPFTLAFERQLESIEQRIFEAKFRELKAERLIPTSNRDNPGSQTITYYLFDKVGAAKIIANPADDLPRSDAFATRHTANVRVSGTSFGFTTQELRSAALTNVALEERKADSARRAMMEKRNKVAWLGDADHGLLGFINNPNVPQFQVPLNGGATSRLWVDKTPQEIIDDVADILGQVRTASKQVHTANTLLMPFEQFELIARKRIEDNFPNRTILSWLLSEDSGMGLDAVEGLLELTGTGIGGADQMLAYDNDSEVVEQRIPMPMIVHPPQPRNLEFIINLEEELAGTVVRFPLATRLAYGI